MIMATGRPVLRKKSERFYQEVETVVVKYAEGRFLRQMSAENQDPGYAGGDGREGSKAGKRKKPVAVPDSLEMEITFQQVNLADGAMR